MKLESMLSRTRRGALTLALLALLFAPIGRASAPAGRYTVASGTVTDNQTGLVWQQMDDGKTYTFPAAQQYCVALGGTWRVPTPNELLTIVDETRSAVPPIDPAIFPNTPAGVFWTSAPSPTTGRAYFVDFGSYGNVADYYPTTDPFSVRCVH